jgi:two-component system phosphate regulon sensor histidine kinase PhoR
VPSRQRSFWNLTLIFTAIFAPLAIGVTLFAILLFDVKATLAIGGLLLLSVPALVSATATAWLFGQRFAESVNSVRDVISQATTGDFGGRVPGDQRFLIEPLSQSIDRMQEYLRSRFAELQANRDQLRTVLDSMVEGVIAVDSAQRVLLINDAACHLFRLQNDASVGRPLWERVRSPQLQQWVAEALRGSESVGGEVELIAPLSRTLSVRVAGLQSNSNRGAVVVASDISQLRRLEQVRQEFVANASHELKTPLASIKACVETLLDGALEDPEIRTRFLQTINEQSERLDRLIRDLLSLTRIESEGMKTDLHSVPLAEIVTVCHERHRQNAERKRMHLNTLAPAEPVQVLADEEALEQILDNLVDNAIKYTNEGGTVTIRWGYHDGGCQLEVEDTGIGIPQSHLPRIFERFYRVDKARSRELGGTGLGLSIVKHMVQAIGGAISVSSRLGKGTTFTVQLRTPEGVADPHPEMP